MFYETNIISQGLDDEKMKLAAIDIFSYIVEFSPSMVRDFILHESISVDDVSAHTVLLLLEECKGKRR